MSTNKKMENVADIYPLTPTQSGILFHTLRSDDKELYFEQVRYDLVGELNQPLLQQAVDIVIRRHPILRTMFVWERVKEPLQIVRKTVTVPWQYLDWRDRSSDSVESELEILCQEQRQQGFDLTRAPIIRLLLVQLTDERTHLIWNCHHILLDGWSSAQLFAEWFDAYEALVASKPVAETAAHPFKSYVAWLKKQDPATAEAFWQSYLAAFKSPTLLASAQSQLNGTGRAKAEQELSLVATSALQALAQQERLTLNTIVQAAWGILLTHYCDSDDVLFGATVSGRPATLPHVESIVGMFSTTLPLRLQPRHTESFLPWLQQLQREQLSLRRFEYASLADIHRWSELPAGSPLFDSILVFENYPIPVNKPQRSLQVTLAGTFDQSNYGLDLMILPGPTLRLMAQYDTGQFEQPEIERLLTHFTTLLAQIAARPNSTIGAFKIMSAAEAKQLTQLARNSEALPTLPKIAPAATKPMLTTLWPLTEAEEVATYPAAIMDDISRFMRYVAQQSVETVWVEAEMLDRLLSQFPAIARRLPSITQWMTLLPYPQPDLMARFKERLPNASLITFIQPPDVDRPVSLVDSRTAVSGRHALGAPLPNTYLQVVDRVGKQTPFRIPGYLQVVAQQDGASITSSSTKVVQHENGEILRWRPQSTTTDQRERPAENGQGESSATSDVAATLLAIWRETLGVAEIQIDDNFFDLGGHSTLAVALFARLKREFKIDLPLATLFKAATPRQILALIDSSSTATQPIEEAADALPFATEWQQNYQREALLHVVEITTGQPNHAPFFCVHGAGGNVVNFRDLALELGEEIPFYGIQAAGVDGIQPPHESVDRMVGAYLEELLLVQPAGPYHIGGYSGGGVIAYEMAQRLQAMGHTVARLILFDTMHPIIEPKRFSLQQHFKLWRRNGNSYVRDQLENRKSKEISQVSFVQTMQQTADNFDIVPFEMRDRQLTSNLYDILRAYDPPPYTGPVTLFVAKVQFEMYAHVPDDRGWQALIPALELVYIDGDHNTLILPPNTAYLAAKLRICLTSSTLRQPHSK